MTRCGEGGKVWLRLLLQELPPHPREQRTFEGRGMGEAPQCISWGTPEKALAVHLPWAPSLIRSPVLAHSCVSQLNSLICSRLCIQEAAAPAWHNSPVRASAAIPPHREAEQARSIWAPLWGVDLPLCAWNHTPNLFYALCQVWSEQVCSDIPVHPTVCRGVVHSVQWGLVQEMSIVIRSV